MGVGWGAVERASYRASGSDRSATRIVSAMRLLPPVDPQDWPGWAELRSRTPSALILWMRSAALEAEHAAGAGARQDYIGRPKAAGGSCALLLVGTRDFAGIIRGLLHVI